MSTTKRTRKPRAAAQHPKSADMIVAAINGMKERGGTSRQKIIKYIGANYKVGNAFEVQVRLAIKRMLQAKKLIQVKGSGASGSFRLSAKAKKPTKARRRRPLKKRGARKTKKRTTRKRRSSGSRKKKARKTTRAGKKRRSTSKRPAKKPRTQSKRKASKKTSRRGRK